MIAPGPHEVEVGAHLAIVPRIVTGVEPLNAEMEDRAGTFASDREPALIATIEAAGLRGRGGAGFPTARKLAAVRAAAGDHVLVANGGEGEPSSVKDRWLMTHRPHLVLDGMFRAARAIEADRMIVFVTDPHATAAMRAAVGAHPTRPHAPQIEMHVAEPRYVAGEETAACRSINGGPPLPTDKPPRPFESGVDGLATAVVNVETLAHLSFIARQGAEAYRTYGTEPSPGTTLVTLVAGCRRPGVYEVPFGLTVRELFESVGGGFLTPPRAFLFGGWFGGVLGSDGAELGCCHQALRDAGTGVGCAAFTALGQDADVLGVAADIAAWFRRESAEQCGVCIKGTAAIADAVAELADGHADPATIDKLTRWGTTLRGRGACALLDGAAMLAGSVAQNIVGRPRPADPRRSYA